MRYAPNTQIPAATSRAFLPWLLDELRRIARSFIDVNLYERHAAPQKPQTGDVVLADGSDWNPGSGQGAYIYYASAWHKLG